MNDTPKEPEFYKLYGSFYRRNSFGEFESVMLLGNTEEDIMCKIAIHFKVPRENVIIAIDNNQDNSNKVIIIEINFNKTIEQFALSIKAPTIIL